MFHFIRVHSFILCQNYTMFLLVLNPPPPILRLNIAYFAVAEGWLLLDIGWFVLFLNIFKHVSIFVKACLYFKQYFYRVVYEWLHYFCGEWEGLALVADTA